ncbi:hypothetical protein J2T17_006019 [Paenibacillus mucilaginosus]|uniref:hypothetical protein n=1 Tax=Paenibacillus mucilaginosus TaxID=61624 RepID=UPI003D19EC6F
MNGVGKGLTVAWINDYLDLYNYAKALGDEAWQADILETLRLHDVSIRREEQAAVREQLWRQFDALNLRLLELYARLREADSGESAEELQGQIWALKVERIRLTNRICSSRRESGAKTARRNVRP